MIHLPQGAILPIPQLEVVRFFNLSKLPLNGAASDGT